jgi:NADH-quinone oxidoreductase subunit C
MSDSSFAESVKNKFPNMVLEAFQNHGDSVIIVKKEGIKNLCAALKKDPEFSFNMLIDLSAVDYLFWEEKALRFEVVYNLFSLSKHQRLFVKAQIAESDPTIDSVTSIWPAANWYEREVWDMFGIQFKGHPNLKRILMYEGFEGHPLRKDYPYNKRQPLIGPKN